jgi:hypothetical protein
MKMEKYELMPTNGRKSFYGKAFVEVDDYGVETLFSYLTPIIKRFPNGTLKRLYDKEPSNTTVTHIKSFCGLTKRQFMAL